MQFLNPEKIALWSLCPAAGVAENLAGEKDIHQNGSHFVLHMVETIWERGNPPDHVTGPEVDNARFFAKQIKKLPLREKYGFLDSADISEILNQENTKIRVPFWELYPKGTLKIFLLNLKHDEIKAEENPLGTLLAAGMFYKLKGRGEIVDKVVINVVNCFAQTVDKWELPIDLIRVFCEHVREAATHAADLLNKRKALTFEDFTPQASTCSMCGGVTVCPALRKAIRDALTSQAEIDHPDAVIFSRDTTGRIEQVLTMVEPMRIFCRDYELAAIGKILSGKSIPNYKVVDGDRDGGAWRDESGIWNQLKSFRLRDDEISRRRLLTPAEAEQWLKPKLTRIQWEKVRTFIERKEFQPAVAPLDDPRPAIEAKTNE